MASTFEFFRTFVGADIGALGIERLMFVQYSSSTLWNLGRVSQVIRKLKHSNNFSNSLIK